MGGRVRLRWGWNCGLRRSVGLLTAFGASFLDEDADGLCDDIDECVGEYDECGVQRPRRRVRQKRRQ